jgi:3-phosphoshikimate 1-carboxyvinyltransferase
MSHRAAMFGAMSADPVHVTGFLDAAYTRSTLAAVHALGALVEEGAPGTLTIRGPGLRAARDAHIDVGNAGTLMRLLPGWLAGQDGGSAVSIALLRSPHCRSITSSHCRVTACR